MDQVLGSNMAHEVVLTYEYEQLDLTKQQIRLIVLHRATNPADPITCEIKTFDTETGPHYVALSYTWGPVNPQRTILINGRSLSIRKNLHDFLERYRNYWENVNYLWIDQMCISQAHEGERNHQVKLMSQIYSHSLSTIIWLGESSRVAADRFWKEADLEDVYTLFRNRYFTRLWVVQEIGLSSHKRVLCGDIWVEFDELVSTMTNSRPSRYPPLGLRNLQYLEDQYDYRLESIEDPHNNTSHRKGHETLKECLERFHDYACEDPRDKVYGILSLVREEDRLEVDYNKSTEEVFLQVVTSNAPWTHALSRFGDNMDIDSMVDLSRSMGLFEHHEVLRGFLMEIRARWADRCMENFEAGFQRRTHQTAADCPNLYHAEKGCCSDLWWFSLDGIKYYRDQGSYGGEFTHFLDPLSPWYYRSSAKFVAGISSVKAEPEQESDQPLTLLMPATTVQGWRNK